MESKVLQETKANGLNYNYLSLGNLKSINTLLNSIDKLPEEAWDGKTDRNKFSVHTMVKVVPIRWTFDSLKRKKITRLKNNEWSITDEALGDLIKYYTREAGVRGLEREIASLCRKAIKDIVKGTKKSIKITVDNLEDYAGIRKFRHGLADKENLLGITTGLAYTDFGGDLLSIEAVTMTGKGRQQITGQLGDVMKESVQAATSYVRSRAVEFGIEPPLFERKDIHA